jgi:hypothetical protein
MPRRRTAINLGSSWHPLTDGPRAKLELVKLSGDDGWHWGVLDAQRDRPDCACTCGGWGVVLVAARGWYHRLCIDQGGCVAGAGEIVVRCATSGHAGNACPR